MVGADDCSAMKFSSSPPPEKLTLAMNGVNVLVKPAPSLVSTGHVTPKVPGPALDVIVERTPSGVIMRSSRKVGPVCPERGA